MYSVNLKKKRKRNLCARAKREPHIVAASIVVSKDSDNGQKRTLEWIGIAQDISFFEIFKIFSITIYIQYYYILVSDVQHSG